jgi:dienelactone hydrolase
VICYFFWFCVGAMTMRELRTWAILCTIAAFAFAGIAKAQDHSSLQLFSIKSGETLPIRVVTLVTATCDPLFLDFEGIDVLEGPPELSLQFEPGMVHTFTTTHECPKPVNGGTVVGTAKEVTGRKEALLAFRVRMKTKQGPKQLTARYRVLLFPSGEQHGDAQPVRARTEELATGGSERFVEPAKEAPSVLSEAARRVSAGDIMGAREILSKYVAMSEASASATDIASGAMHFALAETYDPNVLAAWGSKGVQPDVVRAKQLYRQAMERGHPTTLVKAVDRLVALRDTAPVPPIPSAAAPVTTASTQAVVPSSAIPSALHSTVEDGYRIEEGFFDVKIRGTPFLLQGLIVKRADAVGKLPIMLYTHGVTSSMKQRQEMTPRGAKDANLRLVRDYARRGWLGVFVLRRAYGQSDGPDPVGGFKCDSPTPSLQDGIDAAADDLEATLDYIGRREDADSSRIIALGVSGGGAAVVALSARNNPGLKVVANVSGAFAIIGCANNAERIIAAMRYYGTTAKIPNLWYYAKNDNLTPEQTVVKMREAFLAGGAYAKLVHYPKLIDPSTNVEVDGHQLWGKRTSTVMLDVDGYLHNRGLPTWDYGQAKALAKKNGINTASNFIELYLASPGYKALAQSTSSASSLADTYSADTLEHAKERAIAACQKRNPGHTCKIIDPPKKP